MRRPIGGQLTVGALAVGLTACSGRSSGDAAAPVGSSATTAAAVTPAASAGTPGSGVPGAPPCPHDGRWRACSVAERLEQAGLVPRRDTAPPPAVPFLSAPDTVFRLGLGAVHAFLYADTARLARDVAAMDTARVAPRGGTFAWPAPPTFVRSANLVAVVLTANERQIERVQLALGAGPPQRNPDRP